MSISWKKILLTLCEKQQYLNERVILSSMPHQIHSDWDNFMRGKTCPLMENGDHGVYSWDLKQFLSKV
jgi:hypothetical protein